MEWWAADSVVIRRTLRFIGTAQTNFASHNTRVEARMTGNRPARDRDKMGDETMINGPSTIERPDGRTIAMSEGNIRTVCYGDSECWRKFVIVPRQYMIDRIRARRAAGAQYHDCDWWTLIPIMFRSAGYGGPGQYFSGEPYRYHQTRHVVTFYQTGGTDV